MTRRLNLLLLALLALVALPAWWWLLDNPMADGPAKPLTVATLRDLAGAIPGPAPRSVEMEVLARREEPATLAAAGSGLRFKRVAAIAYHLAVPGRGSVVIDAGAARITRPAPDDWHISTEAITRMTARAQEASLAVSTARLAPGQDAGLSALAPGVVGIPAAGGQMIFARLADGREVLFTGDIAPLTANWLHLRAPSRWRGQAEPPERRREAEAWLRTIREWHRQAPGLVILPGRDVGTVRHLVTRELAVRPSD